MNPKITIALFNYCQAKYLPDSLNALLSQVDPPDELLIFDDASNDNSVELLKAVPNAKFYFNSSNQGIIANVAKALEIATCDYIAIFPADDILHPRFIAEHRKLHARQAGLGLTCSDCVFFEDKFPRIHQIHQFFPLTAPQIYSPEETIALFRTTPFTVLSVTCVYNRHLLRKFGGYKAELKSLCDFYLNAQIALQNPIGYIPQPLAAARLVVNSYGDALRRNRKERKKIYSRLFELVYKEEPADFRNAYVKARLMSFCGLFLFYYLLINPKYWFCFPSLLLKNWRFNLYKVYCMALKKAPPKLPVKPVIAAWP
ncbi:MAG TPA: glycosyltransferase [Chlamydiales bacterium]|nr:glycosyltransferase [Chlamydiales bacterium]